MFLTGFILCLKKVLTISYGFIEMFHLLQSRCLWFSMVQQSLFRLPRIRSRWFNHGFLTNIIAYFQQNRYVWFAIYVDWFTLKVPWLVILFLNNEKERIMIPYYQRSCLQWVLLVVSILWARVQGHQSRIKNLRWSFLWK